MDKKTIIIGAGNRAMIMNNIIREEVKMRDENPSAKGAQIVFKAGPGGLLDFSKFLGWIRSEKDDSNYGNATRPSFGSTGSFKQNRRKQLALSRRRNMGMSARN